VRCPRCGNENPATNRFCGMCGGTLLAPPEPVAQNAEFSTRASSPAPPPSLPSFDPAPLPPPKSAERPVEREESPTISGPSFLGLNEPPPSRSRRGSLSIDPHSSSRDLDYLLDDEEPRGGAGKYILILVALLVAIGFGYWRFKDQGLAWLKGSNKPSAAATDGNDGKSSAPAGGGNTSAPASSTPAISQEPASSSPTPTPNAGPAAVPAQPSTTPGASAPAGASSSPPSETVKANPPAAKTEKSTDDSDDDSDTADSAAPPAAKPKPAPERAAPRTKPSPVLVGSMDMVSEAQKYIYGKGVTQDCDRGLRLLKPAADRANTKAMIEMGALYSAGLCTPRDLPTSYRWFAMALRKDPENSAVQSDLQKLWGEMTQPERQLAIRLSQ